MNDVISTIFNINTLAAAIRMATPIALAAMGGAFSERSGIINIGLEGMILIGAFAGVLGSFYTGSPWFGVFLAMVAGGLLGAIFALFTIKFKADHVVAGVGLNILTLGFTTWLMQILWGSRGTSPNVNGLKEISIPVLKDIPVIGKLLGTQSPLVYLMFILVFSGWVLLFKTPLGLRIRITGEHPEAADTLGINIKGIQYFSVILSGILSGLGGVYLSLGHLNWFSMNMSAGRGYMALAANIFGQWNPLGGLAASFLFSFTDAIQMRLQSLNIGIASELIQMLPYLLTIVVLAGAVVRSRPPEALGKHYETGK
ncbi:ABC transporter permease [Anoxybacter fermentans]|nr:ABC transporter permease [Anoxybacter fermentans]